MFARFRQVRDRLNVSLVEAIRTGAKVRQSHVASLGSVPLPLSAADRLVFGAKANPRLDRLGNRLDDQRRAGILSAIHARIPMPEGEELEAARDAAQNAGREANAGMFGALRDKHRGLAEVYRKAVEREAAAAESVDSLETAHAGRPMTHAEKRRFLKSLGITDGDLRHFRDMRTICELFGEKRITSMLSREHIEAGERATRRSTRRLAVLTRTRRL